MEAATGGRRGVAVVLRSGQSLLEQPGLLASMILPEPEPEHASAVLPRRASPGWSIGAALAIGAAVAAGAIDLAARLRQQHGLSTFPMLGWSGGAVLVVLLAWLVRTLSTKGSRDLVSRDLVSRDLVSRDLVAAAAALAAAVGCAVAAGGAVPGLAGALLVQVPLGCGLGLWRSQRVRRDAVLAAAAAGGCVVALASLSGGACGEGGLDNFVRAAILLAALVVVGAAAAGPLPPQTKRSRRAAFAATSFTLAVLAVTWTTLPAGLGLGGEMTAATAGFVVLLTIVAAGLGGRAPGLAAGAALAGACLVPQLVPAAAPPAAATHTVLAERGDCAAVYQRQNQELQLYERGRWLDAAGPDRAEAALAVTLLQALLRPGDRVQVLDPGLGRATDLLLRLGAFVVDVSDPRPQLSGLRLALLGDGPVPPAADTPAAPLGGRVFAAGAAATLRALAPASRQAVLFAAPLGDRDEARLYAELQLLARRAVGDGLVVQVVALDHVRPSVLSACCAAARAAHPWNGAFVVGDALVLVGAAAAPDWQRLAPFSTWSELSRWTAYEAHLGDLDDLRRSQLGTLGAPQPMKAAGGGDDLGRHLALRALAAGCTPVELPPVPAAGSLLQWWQSTQATLRATLDHLALLPDDAAGRHEALAAAARWLPRGAPAAALQAALGLVGADGMPLTAPERASLAAHALDPTFFSHAPPVFRSLPRPGSMLTNGELEDLARLPAPARLAELCVGASPLAVALRARFPGRCAQALLAQLATAALGFEPMQALRELADPFVLAEAGRVLQARGAGRELLGLWRADLPMPAVVAELLQGSPEDRAALAAALHGRRDVSVFAAIATLLVAPEPELRRQAAELLRSAVGDRIAYDPEWPAAARNEAARQLRALHNRAP
ncbi:MAG: hypothetical protein IT455_14625 [Planctomycetes bacterium]|nr:hypothetical protein [Planctomycetota bacterium]